MSGLNAAIRLASVDLFAKSLTGAFLNVFAPSFLSFFLFFREALGRRLVFLFSRFLRFSHTSFVSGGVEKNTAQDNSSLLNRRKKSKKKEEILKGSTGNVA